MYTVSSSTNFWIFDKKLFFSTLSKKHSKVTIFEQVKATILNIFGIHKSIESVPMLFFRRDATGRMKNDTDNQRPDRNIAVFEALTPSLRLHRSSLPCWENKKYDFWLLCVWESIDQKSSKGFLQILKQIEYKSVRWLKICTTYKTLFIKLLETFSKSNLETTRKHKVLLKIKC